MAYYLIKKRFRGELPVYCAEVRQKRKGQKMFSKSKNIYNKKAQDWIQGCSLGYTGHQRTEVRRAVKNELASLDSFLEN